MSSPQNYGMSELEQDIWSAAGLLVKRHGRDAAIIAAQGADSASPRATLRATRFGSALWTRRLSSFGRSPAMARR
jgi:hypothetical protein